MPNLNRNMTDLDLNDVVKGPSEGSEKHSVVNYDEGVVVPAQDLNDDIITVSIKDDELPDAVLKAVLLGFSEEQESLRRLRIRRQSENESRDTSQLSLKRGTLLKYMSDALIQRQALVGGVGDLDFRGPKFREIIKMFLGVIADTFDEVNIPPEYKELFFQALSRNLEGWELRAEKILKSVR